MTSAGPEILSTLNETLQSWNILDGISADESIYPLTTSVALTRCQAAAEPSLFKSAIRRC